MNTGIIPVVASVVLIATVITSSFQSVNASTTFAEGSRDGKAQGHSDAINGRPSDASCGSGHSNSYCAGYKIAYNAEYYWTKLVQD
jgi:hypothetical protein